MKTVLPRILTLAMLLAGTGTTANALTPEEVKKLPPAQIEKALPNEHPASYYAYASRLFAEGKKDDAVFWFYVGQLRYRIFLAAKPPANPQGDPAVFSSLSATVGQTINEYAGGDPKMWAAQMGKALQWDDTHPNALVPKDQYKEATASVRAGLEKMKKQIEATADQIREQRKKNGLENRG